MPCPSNHHTLIVYLPDHEWEDLEKMVEISAARGSVMVRNRSDYVRRSIRAQIHRDTLRWLKTRDFPEV